MDRLQGPHRASADLAGGPRHRGQADRRDRLRRDRGDADPGDGRTSASMSPCCSARRPTSAPAATPSSWPRNCGGCRSRRNGSTRSCGARSCSSRTPFTPPLVYRARDGQAGTARRHPRRARPRHDDIVEKHFTPSYRPWRQRIAFVPDGDLFEAIRAARPPSSPTRSTASPRRHSAEVRRDAGGRHHRHRDRLQPQCARRHRLRDRRQAAGFRRHRHLSRHDVHRHPQHGLGVRLFPRQLDAARRPGGGLRLPPAQPHESEGREEGRAGAAAAGRQHAAACPGSIRRTSIPAI